MPPPKSIPAVDTEIDELMIDRKRCAHCGRSRNLIEYWLDKKSPDGFRSSCRDCMREISTNWYRKNKDKINAKRRARKLALGTGMRGRK